MYDKKYKVYKKLRAETKILLLPLKLAFVFIGIVVLLIFTMLNHITIGGFFFRGLFIAFFYGFLLFFSTKMNSIKISMGEKIPNEVNLNTYDHYRALSYNLNFYKKKGTKK